MSSTVTVTHPANEQVTEEVFEKDLQGWLDQGWLPPETAHEAEPAPGLPARPAESANKAEWVVYIEATTDLTATDAESLTKQELIDLH